MTELRTAIATEFCDIEATVTSAFRDGGHVADLWSEVVSRQLDRANIVAVDDGTIVGHVGVSHAWLDARKELVDVLMLSPLSVRPDWQGHGIGTSLVTAAIGAARALDAPALFVEGNPAFYGDRGFERARPLDLEAPSRRSPEPAFQVAILSSHQSWMTGRLVYHDVWWQYDSAGLRDPELSRVERALGVNQ